MDLDFHGFSDNVREVNYQSAINMLMNNMLFLMQHYIEIFKC